MPLVTGKYQLCLSVGVILVKPNRGCVVLSVESQVKRFSNNVCLLLLLSDSDDLPENANPISLTTTLFIFFFQAPANICPPSSSVTNWALAWRQLNSSWVPF